MSEAVKIKEGGIDRSQNQINKLKTNTVGGGVCYWIPETELKTESKSINKNGTYTAEEEGLYGYSEIYVSVPGAGGINGKDNPGGDWGDYNVNVDEDGYIVEKAIPSAIHIEIPPLKNSYTEGEQIDLTGIIVKLIDGNGNVFTDEAHPDGTIPLSELAPSPTTAQTSGSGNTYSDGDGLNVLLVTFTTPTNRAAIFCGDVALGVYSGKNCTIAGSINTASTLGTQVYVTRYGDVNYYYGLDLKGANSIQMDLYDIDTGKRLGVSSSLIYQSEWKGSRIWEEYLTNVPVSTKRPTSADIGNLQPTSATVSVNWVRPEDGTVLSDNFDVFIESSESGIAHGNESGGSSHGF